jgi:leucyl aminopeptidase (aminopeptidase T)
MTTSLDIPYDPELDQGASQAITTCLRLQPHERITVIADRGSLQIGAALVAHARAVGAEVAPFVLEEVGNRPVREMPAVILEDLRRSQVSVYTAQAVAGELGSRAQLTEVVQECRLRHGHMVNISPEIMRQGMRADFAEVDRLSSRLVERARAARTIRATSKGGTDIVVELSPALKWLKTSGIISVDKWGNLPGGEIFTSPANLNGVFVVDGVVGDYLCARYGDLRSTPLTIEISDARIASLHCANRELLEEFSAYVRTDTNSDRVGEFAIGTNIGITDIIGQILQDEKLPGVHIAFGHPYTRYTGQTWDSATHIDCVGRDFDIWMDDDKVMENGTFLT